MRMNVSEAIMHKATDNQGIASLLLIDSSSTSHPLFQYCVAVTATNVPCRADLIAADFGFRLRRRVHTECETKAREDARDNQDPCVQR
jgi:hypothetical protein